MGNDAPHSELVQDFDERLMVILTQGGIKLPKHCELDSAHVCNACHGGTPFQRVKEATVNKRERVRSGLSAEKFLNSIRYGVDIKRFVENKIRKVSDCLFDLW